MSQDLARLVEGEAAMVYFQALVPSFSEIFGVCSVLSIGVIEGNFGGVIVFLCQHPRNFAEGSVHLAVWSLLIFFLNIRNSID